MPDPGLSALWNLHRIDAAIVELKRRAEAFDPTREIAPKLRAAKARHEAAAAELQRLRGELRDRELAQSTLKERLVRLDEQLYGGSVVNAKEAALLEAEMAHVREQIDALDLEQLELMERVAAAESELGKIEPVLAALQKQAASLIERGRSEQERMQAEYAELRRRRPEAARAVPEPLLRQYEAIRAKHDGIGMSEITDKGTCARCGTELPKKTILAAREDRLVTCENCRRILICLVPEA